MITVDTVIVIVIVPESKEEDAMGVMPEQGEATRHSANGLAGWGIPRSQLSDAQLASLAILGAQFFDAFVDDWMGQSGWIDPQE